MSREMAGPLALSYRSTSSMTRQYPIDLVIRGAVRKFLQVAASRAFARRRLSLRQHSGREVFCAVTLRIGRVTLRRLAVVTRQKGGSLRAFSASAPSQVIVNNAARLHRRVRSDWAGEHEAVAAQFLGQSLRSRSRGRYVR
jgi:hypothetical protein